MLDDEYDIEEHAEVSQGKLDWVSSHSRPVALQVTINQQLTDRQDPSSEIEKYLHNRPAAR